MQASEYATLAMETDPLFPSHLHAHMFRHSIAIAMYKKGVPLSYIQGFLGHESIDTVRIYAYADSETIEEALKKVNHEENGSMLILSLANLTAPLSDRYILKNASFLTL